MGRQVNTRLLDKVVMKIKKLREQKGISLQQFYDDTGVHLARIESRKRDISISTLSRICDYLGVTLQEFFKAL